MAPVKQALNDGVLTSLGEALLGPDLESLRQYITPETHLDLSSFWTRAIQANDNNNGVASCKLVSQLLVKIDGERGFAAIGVAFIRRVLSEQSKAIFRNLSSGRPLYVNPTLRMLLTMAQFDAGVLANEVYLSMDFKTFKALPKLLLGSGPQTQQPVVEKVVLGKRKREDSGTKNATRALFIALIFTLLKNAESVAKAELLQQRPIMTELIKHLSSDSPDSISKTLKGLSAVLDNRDIARPAKIQFFNEWTLSQLLRLYRTDDADDEDTLLVRLQTQEFFMKATTIPDQGICFAAHGLVPPPNKKLYNPILAGLVASLRPIDDDLQGELLISILKSCPELIVPWLQSSVLNLTPRLEVEWIKAMQFIRQVLSIPLPEHSQSELDQIPDYNLLELMLPTQISKILTRALQHESDLVKLMALRTFSQSLQNARNLTIRESDRAMEVLHSLQRRAPLIEILVPLANIHITLDTAEELELLREEALIVLAAYLTLFEDLPSFDFVTILNSIMTSADKLGKSGSIRNEEASQTFASALEKDVVLSMARQIDGVPWLAKKKNTKSLFVVIVQYLLGLKGEDQHRYSDAIDTLGTIIKKDSFMFHDADIPVAKIEACIRACDVCKSSDVQSLVVDFMEECMIRFQASPYKYWDKLVETLSDSFDCMKIAISPIMVVFHEQLAFLQDSNVIRPWLQETAANLVCLNESELALEAVIGTTLPKTTISVGVSKWNAVARINRLRHESEASDAWVALPRMIAQLPPNEMAQVKSYLVRYLRSIADLLETKTMVLKLIGNSIDFSDYGTINGMEKLVRSLLIEAAGPVSVVDGLIPGHLAYKLLQEFASQTSGYTDYAVATCFVCLSTSTLPSTCTERLIDTGVLQSEIAIIALTAAIRRKTVEHFNLASLFASLDQATMPQSITIDLVSAFFRNFQAVETDFNGSMLEWFTNVDFITLAPVAAAALSSDVISLRDLGSKLLQSWKVGSEDLRRICQSSDPALYDCLNVRISYEKELAVSILEYLTPTMSAITSLDSVNIGLFRAILQGIDLEKADVRRAFSNFNREIVLLLTKRFAEDRVEEGKFLSEATLAFVQIFSDFISDMPYFAIDCGPRMLQTMTEAALENHSQQNDVLRFLAALVSSTKTEAFNYTRTIQNLLSKELMSTEIARTNTITLLRALIMHDATKINLNVLDELIRHYHGTNSLDDHLLYDCLCASETALKISIGTRFGSWRLIESGQDVETVTKTPSAVISSELALDTIMNYSDRKTFDTSKIRTTYDERFILPLIGAFIQSDDSVDMLKQLIEHHAVGLVFLGLSSRTLSIRQQSSFLLSRVYKIVLSSTIKEKAELETIFGLVRDSISAVSMEEQPIPRIQAVFLALATHIMLNPSHYLYEKINRFLLARPTLDLTDIPLFLNLFNSHDNYVKDVSWLLRLLAAGITDGCEAEYRRRHVLEMCMGLYRSQTANVKIKECIHEIFSRALECQGMRWYFQKVGGFAWLQLGNESELDSLRSL